MLEVCKIIKLSHIYNYKSGKQLPAHIVESTLIASIFISKDRRLCCIFQFKAFHIFNFSQTWDFKVVFKQVFKYLTLFARIGSCSFRNVVFDSQAM